VRQCTPLFYHISSLHQTGPRTHIFSYLHGAEEEQTALLVVNFIQNSRKEKKRCSVSLGFILGGAAATHDVFGNMLVEFW